MVAARPSPRTSIVTFAACADRNTAAWPAELPPPTSTTSCCAQIFASIAEAQYQTPRPSNSRQPRHVGPAIARAAGDHRGARAMRRPSRQGQHELAAPATSLEQSRPTTWAGISISAPNFCACT